MYLTKVSEKKDTILCATIWHSNLIKLGFSRIPPERVSYRQVAQSLLYSNRNRFIFQRCMVVPSINNVQQRLVTCTLYPLRIATNS